MSYENNLEPTILVTGGTGQVGRAVIRHLAGFAGVQVIAGVRDVKKASNLGVPLVELDYDRTETIGPALQGVSTVFLMTGYTIDMLRQSKSFLDIAKTTGVNHIVHLGACGSDDATVAHWGWHQFVERYIEWCGFSYTHLRPEAFMQNIIGYQGNRATNDGELSSYFGNARMSWVDCDDVAAVAAACLVNPGEHRRSTYRLGYDAKTYSEIAQILTDVVGQPFTYAARPPEEQLELISALGLEPAYMRSIYDHCIMYARDQIPGAGRTYDNFEEITGKKPTTIRDFAVKHRAAFAYTSKPRISPSSHPAHLV